MLSICVFASGDNFIRERFFPNRALISMFASQMEQQGLFPVPQLGFKPV